MKYITDEQVSNLSGRNDSDSMTSLKYRIRNKWVKSKTMTNFCGNVRVIFKDNKAIITDEYYDLVYVDKTHNQSYLQISSALALYRTLALLHTHTDNSDRQDFYKINWSITLKHKATGCGLMLGEWKGGFQIFTEHCDSSTLPEKFKKDAEELLSMIANPEMTIDYDGVYAGDVA